MNDRPDAFVPRSDLEGLLASSRSSDWVKIRFASFSLETSVCIDISELFPL
jgi:hypothetical protein